MRVILTLGAVLSCLVAASAFVQRSSAHTGDLGYVWADNTMGSERVEDDTLAANGWGSLVSAGVSSWWNNSTLWVNVQAPLSGNSIFYFDGDYGDSGWYGVANVYSDGTVCGGPTVPAPGGCNKSTVKANRAVLSLNNYYASDYSTYGWLKQQVTTHELGHVFGLSHPTCSDNAVMDIATCFSATSVTSHDAWHVSQLGY